MSIARLLEMSCLKSLPECSMESFVFNLETEKQAFSTILNICEENPPTQFYSLDSSFIDNITVFKSTYTSSNKETEEKLKELLNVAFYLQYILENNLIAFTTIEQSEVKKLESFDFHIENEKNLKELFSLAWKHTTHITVISKT